MKPLFTTLRGLAAAVLLSVILITSVPAGAKLHGRGFVEAGLGITTVEGSNVQLDNGGGVALGYMFSFTYGIQLQKNHIGIGLGLAPRYLAGYKQQIENDLYIYRSEEKRISSLSIPVFLSYRYDFFSSGKKLEPFIGLRFGLINPMKHVKYYYTRTFQEYEHTEYAIEYGSVYPYFSLDFGMRKRISASSGFSLGISVQDLYNLCLVDDYLFIIKETCGVCVLAKIGFDF